MPKFFCWFINLGNRNLTVTEQRYLRITNVIASLSALFLISWAVIAFSQGHLTLAIINFLEGASFTLVLLFNWLSLRFPARLLYMIINLAQTYISLYLFGFESGVYLIFILNIIIVYAIFPEKHRGFAHGFALLAWASLTLAVYASASLVPHLTVFPSHFLLLSNASMVSAITLFYMWNSAVTIDQSEHSLLHEREKSDALLHNILPDSVVPRLKENDNTHIADRIPFASVMFADIAGFTTLSNTLPPDDVVRTLNEIFTEFDRLLSTYALEKIKTIGDAYMVARGLFDADENHPESMVRMGLEMQAYMKTRSTFSNENLQMRIGIHCGPIVAGVIGVKKFAYDIWGDTVNTAARMEQNGEAGEVNISETTYALVKDKFTCEDRGEIDAKNKGKLKMYFVRSAV